MAFYFDKILFNNLDFVLKLFKKQEHSLDSVLNYFDQEQNRDYIIKKYDYLPFLKVSDVFILENAEQRMSVLKMFSAEEISKELNPILLDKKTIAKKQIIWDKDLKPKEISFEDTYELYQIKKEKLFSDFEDFNQNEDLDDDFHESVYQDIFYVKCDCPSTQKNYYIYVPSEVAEEKDAITAIAWTFTIEGEHLNKEQYLSLMYSES